MEHYDVPVCPIDGKDDNIQKLSAIYARDVRQNTGTIRTGIYQSHVSTQSTSRLGRLVTPPPRPVSVLYLLRPFIVLIVVFLLLTLYFLASGLESLSEISSLNTGNSCVYVTPPSYAPGVDQACETRTVDEPLQHAALCGILTLGILALSILRGISLKRAYPQQIEQWNNRYATWDMLYYCSRHDILFPSNDRSVFWKADSSLEEYRQSNGTFIKKAASRLII